MACIIETQQIRELAAKFPNYTIIDIRNKVGTWQELNNKSPEEYPTEREFREFINKNEVLVKGENISSKGSPLAKKLTNPGNNISVEYKGKTFRNAEHAYQTWKSGEFDEVAYNSTAFKPVGKKRVNKDKNFDIMVDILTHKLQQHPELVEEVEKAGGLSYIRNSTHSVTGDVFWEKQGNFIKALYQAAVNVGMKDDISTKANTKFSTSGNNSYPSRTRENVTWSDMTLAFATDFETAGEKLTYREASKQGKYQNIFLFDDIEVTDEDIKRNVSNLITAMSNDQAYGHKGKTIKTKNIKLNIAGNGIYTYKNKTQEELNDIVTKYIKELINQGISISEIRSGGQTGIDEAGIIAAQRLGIPNEVHSTSNFMFRDISGRDISDEQAFKSRFTSSRPEKIQQEESIEESEGDVFDVPRVTSIEEQQKVDLLFDPTIRRDRVTLIARLFSNEVTNALVETENATRRRIDDAETSKEREELQAELSNLTRFSIIKQKKPSGIFRRVANIFLDYINLTEEERIQQELNRINADEAEFIEAGELDESDRHSDEEKLEAAKRRAAHKYNEFRKMVDNLSVFKALAEEASTILATTEGIKIDPNYIAPSDVDMSEDDPEGNSNKEQSEDWAQEEAYKDGWMTNVRQVSSHESLSQAVRAAIRQVPRLDFEGYYDEDDLGFQRYLDADYVHATLIDKLKDMIDSDDMIPLLQNLARTKPWVNQVIELLQSDDALFSQFYQDFRKDFMPYWIQKKKLLPDGTFKMETIAINKPEGIYYLLDSWRDNYENGITLDKDSIYGKDGKINKDNAEKGLALTEELNNKFNNLSTEERLNLLEDSDTWNSIIKLFHMIGIDVNPSILESALSDINVSPGFTDPIMLLLPNFNIIFSGIAKGEVQDKKDEDGTVKRGDMINTFGSAFNNIANMLANVTEDAIESSVRENDKSYYSHVTPSYLGKLIKNLKNVMNNKERFENFMQSEFKNYEWFFKKGHWRNDWLRQLEESVEMRKNLSHKVLLNSDKIDYTNWDSLDYTLALLIEYWGDPDSAKSNVKYAWYYVPILSDSPSAEFIKFRKYTNGDMYDDEGRALTYDEIILDKMVDIVNQEYDRIMLVRERDAKYQSGDKSISPIANYDIVRDKKGNIKSYGGSEFKFFPYLNNIRYDNGETFLDAINRLKTKGTGAELREFIKDTLFDMMEEGFENDFKGWSRLGLLDELPNGKYKYLSMRIKEGQSKQNEITSRALLQAKNALGSAFTTNMELLLRDYQNNRPINTRNAENLMEEIKSLLNQKVESGNMSAADANKISRSLFVKNNAKEALREYYWNSKLATAQIIQLTTTDLAFYKNLEDFQKRYKEVHAPSLRLNTKAMYNGERIGRDWERTIYLKDDEIVSSALEDIKTVLDERVKKGEMSKMDRDNIVYKFRNVNVADAQAYRSLSSYRAILGMSGQWTDDMEKAYNNFRNGNWDISDFNIIWQTKKPFVYTQINNDSGIEGHTGIKTPVQHKNSEFLLLAMHELIAGPLGKSGKLKAINEFMEDNQIDVVQFESTTKVGKQGVIDLNDVNTEADVIQRLKDTTGIGFGNENPNVVHKVSYEDYGIQTQTPEHLLDAVQLVGTQIRKLITADISPDTIIEVDGIKLTKQEWLDLYNKINTENILQSFAEIDEIFKDPKKVEKVILEEVRGSQRYGIEVARACTLDENGNFNIPLFDPVQSQRIQTLLNSIIKSRITKQKIKGGSLIQVSDYGLTDELHIVYEGEGENKRIKYFECYMPAYSRDFYEPLMDPVTHQLDVTKLPDDLRKLIGYRVPTESQYSMAPLFIKGFLPQQNGSAIMLPAEITTIAGSDKVNV